MILRSQIAISRSAFLLVNPHLIALEVAICDLKKKAGDSQRITCSEHEFEEFLLRLSLFQLSLDQQLREVGDDFPGDFADYFV